MTELLALTKRLSISRPVFNIVMSRNNQSINADTYSPVYKYRPEAQEDEILYQLIVKSYRENFSVAAQRFIINEEEIAGRAMGSIRSSVCSFLEKNLEMKNPKQSKVWRWAYRNMPVTREFEDTLVMVYKYMRTICNDSMRVNIVHQKEDHVKNVIAILAALQEKYDK